MTDKPRMLRSNERTALAALFALGTTQPSSQRDLKVHEALHKKELVDRRGATFSINDHGRRWVNIFTGMDNAEGIGDPAEEEKKILDRGLGIATGGSP